MLLDDQEVIQFQWFFLGVFSFLIKSASLSRTAHRFLAPIWIKRGEKKKKKKKRKGKKGVNVCLRLFSYREILLFYQQCNAGDVENSKQTERGMTIAESLETFRWLWCRKRENAQRRSVLTIKVHGRVVGTARFLEQRTYGKVHEKLELHWKPFFHWGCQGRTLYYTRLDSSSNRTSRWCSR